MGLVVVLTSAVPAALLLGARPGAAFADPISDKRAEAAQLAAQIDALGSKIDALTQQYDAAQQHAEQVASEMAVVRAQVAKDRARVRSVQARLRAEAVNSFTESGSVTGSESVAQDVLEGNMGQAGVRGGFVATVAGMEQATIDSLHLAQRVLAAKEEDLRQDQQAAQAALAEIGSARQAAEQASSQEQSLLDSVKGQLAQLVAAQQQAEEAAQAAAARQEAEQAAQQQAAQQQAAQQQAARQAAAAPQQVASTTTTAAPPASTASATTAPPTTAAPATGPAPESAAPAPATPSGDGYANPLRAVSGLVPERIDQGVDYSGAGPLYALGPGVIVNVYNSGWPGGVFIVEQLTAGPYAGQYWYSAEDISPAVSVGEQVNSNTVIGTMYEGGDGIETGWAAPPGDGETMAMAAGEAPTTGDAGSVSTAYGVAASTLLASLGAPPGILQ